MIDIAFLKQYVLLLELIAHAIVILQGEQNCHLGYILSTIATIRLKLDSISTKYTIILKHAHLEGINCRFGSFEEFIMAAVTHPRFKVTRASDIMQKVKVTEVLDKACATLMQQQERERMQVNAPAEPVRELTNNNFFTFTMASTNNTPINAGWSYLQDPDISFSMLHRHPIIKTKFLRYNSSLPSSAAVERLFSAGLIIMTKKRNCLGDEIFEKLLLLRQNKQACS